MKNLITLSLLLAGSLLFAQISDTISWNEVRLKSNTDYIIETLAESNYTIVINEILASNSDGLEDAYGDQDDWFEIYNYGDEPVLIDSLYFSDNENKPTKWQYLSDTSKWLAPNSHMIFWADDETDQGEDHTNFKLSSSGEELLVSTPDLVVIDLVEFSEQRSNISFGRFPDGGEIFNVFTTPSPLGSNVFSDLVELLPLATSNIDGGIYTDAQQLILNTEVEGASIHYTLDCSTPTIYSAEYDQPINITVTTIVRVKLFKDGAVEGETLTLSFIITGNYYTNNVLSLVSDADNFTGSQGIFKNPSSDIEIPAQFEYFEDNKLAFTANAGIKIHSPKSITQYSMRLYARGNYGDSWFEYPFFDDLAPEKFKRLILRNAGNDNMQKSNGNGHFRDHIIQRLAQKSNRNVMMSEAKPINVYVNGQYYGIYNLRERIDKYYIETRTDEEDFDLLERCFGYSGNRNAIEGDYTRYLADEVEATEFNLANDDTFAIFSEKFDMDNYMDYWITEVFVGNYDWLANNIKMWSKTDTPWQWIYWDTDHGLGLNYYEYGYTSWNTLSWSLGDVDRAAGNNKLMTGFLSNDAYKEAFVKRFTQLLNTSFLPTATLGIADSIAQLYQPDLLFHIDKWGGRSNQVSWDEAVSDVENYFTERPDSVRKHIQAQFDLSAPVTLEVVVEPQGAGLVQVDDYQVTDDLFTGVLFPDYQYHVQVIANTGYRFAGWGGVSTSTESEVDISPSQNAVLTAYFETISTDLKPISTTSIRYVENQLMVSNLVFWPQFIKVYDVAGKQVAHLPLIKDSTTEGHASLQQLAQGIYIVHMQSGDIQYCEKVIIP